MGGTSITRGGSVSHDFPRHQFHTLWACWTDTTYHFAIDLDCSMYTELSGLSRTAGKHGSEDGNVQPPLHGGKRHVHVGRRGLGLDGVGIPVWRLVLAGASAGGLLGAVELGHVPRVHVDDRQEAAAEHALPVTLPDVLAVVGTHQALGPPFLLEEGLLVAGADLGVPLPRDVEQVVFVPGLPEFLNARHTQRLDFWVFTRVNDVARDLRGFMGKREDNVGFKYDLPASSEHRASFLPEACLLLLKKRLQSTAFAWLRSSRFLRCTRIAAGQNFEDPCSRQSPSRTVQRRVTVGKVHSVDRSIVSLQMHCVSTDPVAPASRIAPMDQHTISSTGARRMVSYDW